MRHSSAVRLQGVLLYLQGLTDERQLRILHVDCQQNVLDLDSRLDQRGCLESQEHIMWFLSPLVHLIASFFNAHDLPLIAQSTQFKRNEPVDPPARIKNGVFVSSH